ncbi:951_t:CDS:2, partial [Cetraspora pellucida]
MILVSEYCFATCINILSTPAKMDDTYSSSSIDNYFSRLVEFNDESFLSSSLTSQDEVLESQDPAREFSLSIHLVDVTDNDNLPLNIQSLLFSNWQLFKIWIEQFAKQEGFSYKIQTSETYNSVVRRAMKADNGEINNEIREYKNDTHQILLKSLVENISQKAILEVWNAHTTGLTGIRHYVILLNEDTHLCTCLLLINKRLVCQHFFHIETYSQYATFHIFLISACWYLNCNITRDDLLQQIPSILICKFQLKNTALSVNNATFQHFFSTLPMLSKPKLVSNKTIYAELFGLSKKVIDLTIKADMQKKLSNTLKIFHNDTQDRIDENQLNDNATDMNNPNITRHKERPPKMLKSSVKYNGKKVLRKSTGAHLMNNNTSSIIEEDINHSKG